MARIIAVSALASSLGVWGDPSTEKGVCQFKNEPVFPGYFWDASCKVGQLGCLADGKNAECRFCGGGNFTTPCPPSSCHFPNDPFVPYYWDNNCKLGMLGCWADGIHAQCRFCGTAPYTSITCPEERTAPPQGAACTFAQTPAAPFFWDPSCKDGVHGCFADGVHTECRFCGAGDFADITCPASKVCTFANEPTVPYFFDPDCAMGKLGCNADAIHVQCRFCAKRPFESIPCPEPVAPPKNVCTWPRHSEPHAQYYWEPSCKMGVLGCWADGIHAECRFCGQGVFENITCPEGNATSRGSGVVGAAASSADAAGALDVPASGQAAASSTDLSATTAASKLPQGAVVAMILAVASRVGPHV